MEIVRYGEPQSKKMMEGRCGECGCVFRVSRGEAKRTAGDQYDSGCYYYPCPQADCGNKTVNLEAVK